MKKILFALLALATFTFAAETSNNVAADSSAVLAADTTLTVAADSSVSVAPVSAEASYEIALRDSLLAAKDSASAAEKQALQTKLDIESARCGNWEQSYAVLDTNFQTCSKMLRVYAETAEKKTEQLNEARKMNAMAQSTSFIGGVLLGILVGWLIWD